MGIKLRKVNKNSKRGWEGKPMFCKQEKEKLVGMEVLELSYLEGGKKLLLGG